MTRSNNRAPNDLRPIQFVRQFTRTAPGSVLASFGETRVLCTATVTDGVPNFMTGQGKGWLTAEYAMLPSSTPTRKARDRGAKLDGRAVEIQRLIGRTMRAVVELGLIGERTLWIDCDVLQADGGTRTTAISGSWVALNDLCAHLDNRRLLRGWPIKRQLGAVSMGIVGGQVVCDLDYAEDSKAEVDLNLVMTDAGEFVEVQGSAEGATFSRSQLDGMLGLGEAAIRAIFKLQRDALGLT